MTRQSEVAYADDRVMTGWAGSRSGSLIVVAMDVLVTDALCVHVEAATVTGADGAARGVPRCASS